MRSFRQIDGPIKTAVRSDSWRTLLGLVSVRAPVERFVASPDRREHRLSDVYRNLTAVATYQVLLVDGSKRGVAVDRSVRKSRIACAEG